MDSLNEKQEMFCREYLIDLNATQAAIRAGYSEKTADVQGCRLLANVKVQERFAELNRIRIDRVEITADTVLKNLYEIATLDIADVLNDDGTIKDVSTWSDGWRKAIGGIDVMTQINGTDNLITTITKKLKGVDKLKAWELIGKHVNVSAFKDKVELTGENGKPLNIIVTSQEAKEEIEKLQSKLRV